MRRIGRRRILLCIVSFPRLPIILKEYGANVRLDDLDYRVVQSDGIAFFNILQTLGVPSRFLNFPDENHWVTKRDNSLVWHKYIFNWIRFWTGQDEELIQSVEGIDVTKS